MLYLVLFLPFGASAGFVTVTLAYLLGQEGVSTEQIAAIVAASLLPQTWKFLWAPLVDTTLGRKRWYLIGLTLTAAGVLACGIVPVTRAGLLVLSGLVFSASVGSTLLAMAVESLIPHHTPDAQKGRASGWLEAGNLGGSGLGGGAALWIAQHVSPPWTGAAALAGACLLCALPLVWIPRTPNAASQEVGVSAGTGLLREQYARLVFVLKNLWSLARSRRGYLGLLVVFLPIGTGAAANLWAAVAGGWHASADVVALVNGALGGFVSALGCLIGGHYCDRLNRKFAYVLFGMLQALWAVAMALAPHTESLYMLFTIGYALLNGMGYAGYAAVAFEAIGVDGAATQFNAFASLATIPILYMGLIEGWAYERFGATEMLFSEALMAAAAIVVFAVASALSARVQPATRASTSPEAA